jgi:hypothetical protein
MVFPPWPLGRFSESGNGNAWFTAATPGAPSGKISAGDE